jgi:hypothetical protein
MIKLGKFKIMFGHLDSNSHIYHADRPKGERFETRRGPKFTYCRLTAVAPSTGHRFWFYAPSGQCWNVDLYIDRRKFNVHCGRL